MIIYELHQIDKYIKECAYEVGPHGLCFDGGSQEESAELVTRFIEDLRKSGSLRFTLRCNSLNITVVGDRVVVNYFISG